MSELLYLDFETFGTYPITKTGAYRYGEDPLCEPIILSYAFGWGPVTRLEGWDDIVRFFLKNVTKSQKMVAHNANFERVIVSIIEDCKPGEYVHPSRFIDTAAMSAYYGLPRSLDGMTKALGVSNKDSAGSALIRKFSMPQRDGRRIVPEDEPIAWGAFGDYADQDVAAMREAHLEMINRFGEFPEQAQREWEVDQLINDRGVRVDTMLAERAVYVGDIAKARAKAKAEDLTGIDNAGSRQQVIDFLIDMDVLTPDGHEMVPNSNGGMTKRAVYKLNSTGERAPQLDADGVKQFLEMEDLPEIVRELLTLRQTYTASSAAKFNAMLNMAGVGSRARGVFQYFGAHTGRWAGRGIQLQNLPKESLGGEEETQAGVDKLMNGDYIPESLSELKPLIRASVMAPEEGTLTVCDYSAIEARVLAWLAGEEWVLEAFREGRDIYIETAARMFDLEYEEARKIRQKGKVAVLALGYGGGVNALRRMGGEGTDDELKQLVWAWRDANPNIVSFWRLLELVFKAGSGQVFDHISIDSIGNTRRVHLPSGRAMHYHDVQVKQMEKFGKLRSIIHFRNYFKKDWALDPTYGGKLSENVTQAVARDVLANALCTLELYGAEPVAHVHDEVLCQSGIDVDRMKNLMGVTGGDFFPSWAEGLPLAAEGYYCKRYRKE